MIYEIRVKGVLSSAWSDWFDGLVVTNEPQGEATLTGRLPDRAALYGVLNQLQALNLTLISVTPLPDSPADSPLGE
jgi:hypothetical protein